MVTLQVMSFLLFGLVLGKSQLGTKVPFLLSLFVSTLIFLDF